MANCTFLKTVITSVAIVFLVGCGQNLPNKNVSQSDSTMITFTNLLNDMVIKPNPNFNAVSAKATEYNKIAVFTKNGQKILLNASQKPILFEAYWCPHCQRTLVLLNKNLKNKDQMPIIVSTGFPAGTTIAEANRVNQEEMSSLHIQGDEVYYLLDSDSDNSVQHIPMLVFPYHNKLDILYGEHTVNVWRHALSLVK